MINSWKTKGKTMNLEITPKRARELRMLCSPMAFMNDRCKDFKPETEGERKRVKEIWNKNPNGLSSYFSTLCEIEHGRTKG